MVPRTRNFLNDEGVDDLTREPTSKALVDYLEHSTLRACEGLQLTPDTGATPLRCFIARILYHSKSRLNVMLALPVYLGRITWSSKSEGSVSNSTPHQVFFGCLVLTTKYLLDVPPQSSFWVQCLIYSCNNLFFTEEGILSLELRILRHFQWRADIHEHHLLPELDLFLEFLNAALQPVHAGLPGPRLYELAEDTSCRLKWIEAFSSQIANTCLNHPCLLCVETG